MVGNLLFREKILEGSDVGATEKAGRGDAMAVVGEGGGDVDAFAAGMRLLPARRD